MQARPRAGARGQFLGAALLSIALGGCAGEAPPLDDLPLRDALGADPEVIASLPAEVERALAERFESTRQGQPEAEEVQPDARGTPGAEVRDADVAREARGDDALVTAILSPEAGFFVVRPLRLEEAVASRALPPLAGHPPSPRTAEAEARALAGQAGAIVAALVERSGASRVSRVVGWPAGAVAVGDTVYVNASWLVALSALEDKGEARAPPRAPPIVGGPPMQPLSVRGSPYVTYAALEACTSDVDGRCKECLTSGSCDDAPALSDFKNAKDECTFLAADPARAAALCAAALLSIKLIATCVRAEAPACVIPAASPTSTGIDGLKAFLADAKCVHALDVCLGTPTTSPPNVGAGTIGVSKCQDPFSACASSCKGLGDSCTANSCSGTPSDSSCSSCGSSGGSSSPSCRGGSCGKCQTTPAPAFPLGDAAWLLAPLAYVFFRPRKRA